MKTIEEVRAICNKIANSYGYEIKVPIQENGRLKKTLGRVKFEINKKKECNVLLIEFSKDLLEANDDLILDTIRHELAHYFVLIDTKRNHGHDDVWKAWCKTLGCTPRATCNDMTMVAQYKARYFVYCSKCGKLIGRYVRKGNVIKYPNKYRSLCCKAPLLVVENT